MKRVCKSRGLSVIEIMVALVVLATGAIITLGAIGMSLKATSSSAQSSVAICYARRILEIALTPGSRCVVTNAGVNPLYQSGISRSLYDPSQGVAEPLELTDFVTAKDQRDLERFARDAQNYKFSVTISPFVDAVSPNSSAYTTQIYNVRVDLEWFDKLGKRSLRTGAIYSRS
jgi:hypothetical protein